ncbi:hypothetical protein HDU87_005792 [Geranomyces variabilis]|uniref:ABC transporter domain-containing protein n=1 Tax=Geranomyces variabilis TaxID=109894 RepID=A0AAD5THX4_9FUNG|nr:hypothetical protein HDU87_005792 [Geranomyces variabilis]
MAHVPQEDCHGAEEGFTLRSTSVVGPAGETLLSDIAFTLAGGQMCALVGASGSGKSLLLAALGGHDRAGCLVDIEVHPAKISTGFVPTEDILVGELTIRETLRYNAKLRNPAEPSDAREARITALIDAFGLGHVADNLIGTPLKRGLSGGEKRRVSVMVECIARPELLLLDEPCSGLDSASALTVLKAIRDSAQGTEACVIASLQQPNVRLLSLFQVVIILHAGQIAYKGPPNGIASYFEQLGHPLSAIGAPTDAVAQLLGTNPEAARQAIDKAASSQAIDNASRSTNSVTSVTSHSASGPNKYVHSTTVLAHRFTVIAIRAVALYWLQSVLVTGFGFLVGVVFWQLPRVIGPRLMNLPNGTTWIVYVAAYIQVFRVFYLTMIRDRFCHESRNRTVGVLPWAVSDFVVTAVFTFIAFIPGLLIAMFMMHLPAQGIGFSVLVLWIVALTAESLLDLLTQMVQAVPFAVLFCQAALVLTSVFAGGSFISYDRIQNNFWVWLQDVSLYNYATRGIQIHVFKHLNYTCSGELTSSGVCSFSNYVLPCDVPTTDGTCVVKGLTVLAATTGLQDTNEWMELGILFALLCCFRMATALIQGLEPGRRIRKFWIARQVAAARKVSSDPVAVPTSIVEMTERLAASAAADEPASRLSWDCVELCLRSTGKLLVSDMTGHATSGNVLAILGGSGAGKTTFLNALAYRAPYAHITGKVLLNGRPLQRDELIYVPQFDTLNTSMTCMQSLLYAASLYNIDPKANETRSAEILSILDLSHRAGSLVAKLTSGERKRLSVGMALLSNAPILLLDEPTTGLDSFNAKVLVEYVKKAIRLRNVICLMTIHQPSSQAVEHFDSMLLLTKGKTAYFGPADQSERYFNKLGLFVPPGVNPVDFFLDCMAESPRSLAERNQTLDGAAVPGGQAVLADALYKAEHWNDVYKNESGVLSGDAAPAERKEVTNSPPGVPSEGRRLAILIGVMFRYNVTDWSRYLLRGVEMILLALFIGTLFYNLEHTLGNVATIAGAVFFNTWSVLFAAISGIVIHARDRVTQENEFLNGAYALATLHTAVFASSIPFHFAVSVAYNAILWFMVGFNNSGSAFLYAVLATAVLLVLMEGIALLVVTALKDAMLSTTFTMVVLGTFYLFAGFFVQQGDMVRPVFWACWTVPTKYSLNGQLANIFGSQSYATGPAYISGAEILSQYFGLDAGLDASKWGNLGIVVAFMMFFRLVYWAVQAVQYRKYRAQ